MDMHTLGHSKPAGTQPGIAIRKELGVEMEPNKLKAKTYCSMYVLNTYALKKNAFN
jgi:hypothetical protein